jgi:hypothetical protein
MNVAFSFFWGGKPLGGAAVHRCDQVFLIELCGAAAHATALNREDLFPFLRINPAD